MEGLVPSSKISKIKWCTGHHVWSCSPLKPLVIKPLSRHSSISTGPPLPSTPPSPSLPTIFMGHINKLSCTSCGLSRQNRQERSFPHLSVSASSACGHVCWAPRLWQWQSLTGPNESRSQLVFHTTFHIIEAHTFSKLKNILYFPLCPSEFSYIGVSYNGDSLYYAIFYKGWTFGDFNIYWGSRNQFCVNTNGVFWNQS